MVTCLSTSVQLGIQSTVLKVLRRKKVVYKEFLSSVLCTAVFSEELPLCFFFSVVFYSEDKAGTYPDDICLLFFS